MICVEFLPHVSSTPRLRKNQYLRVFPGNSTKSSQLFKICIESEGARARAGPRARAQGRVGEREQKHEPEQEPQQEEEEEQEPEPQQELEEQQEPSHFDYKDKNTRL